jgi:RecB family endonuclease NucS
VAVEVKRRGEIDGTSQDLHAGNRASRYHAVEVKRRAGIEAVEQLSRYLDYLNRDPQLAPVGGVIAAQGITAQARTMAADRNIRCVIVDYDALRGMDNVEDRLF